MILFSNNSENDFSQIRQLTSRASGQSLYVSLYVFTAHSSRPAEVYIAPTIVNAEAAAAFLRQKLQIDVAVEKLGNPPQNTWVALNTKLRDKDPVMCSKICLFLERHINNLIIW